MARDIQSVSRPPAPGAEGPARGLPGERWDLVIRPRAGWFDLHLGDLWRYRDLIMLFVRRDFVALYKQTVLGPVWFVLQPLLTTIIFAVVFGNIARLSTAGLPKMLFYLSGNILWQYAAQCVLTTSNTFRGYANVFGKVYFPRLVVPIALVISTLMKLGLQFLFFLALWGYYALFTDASIAMTRVALLFPVCIVIMGMLGLGCGIVISALTTKYRDLGFLVQFGVQLLMYTTTVIYPLSAIQGGKMRYFVLANPMTPVIEVFRQGFLGAGSFSAWHLAYSAVFAAAILAVGMLLFTRVERTFMDSV